jgi:membrane protease YdiL (CAAX protease family)
MGIYLEAALLYIILFLAGSTSFIITGAGEAAGFSMAAELIRIFLYSIPSLALIWYLLLKVKRLREWKIRPGINDLISGLITLPCLLITGFAIGFISSHLGGESAQVAVYAPVSRIGWVVLTFSCLFAAYLEETFFRFYLLSRRDELKLDATPAMLLSVVLFSLCHIYEGPWGFLNAVLSAVIICYIYLRYQALHGVAIAHGLYNIIVFVLNALAAEQV